VESAGVHVRDLGYASLVESRRGGPVSGRWILPFGNEILKSSLDDSKEVMNNVKHHLLTLKTLYQRPTSEQTRQRILAKADQLIRHFGLTKTTVSDIAAGLGMSPANIYKFFPSKDSIIEASVEEKLAELKMSIEAAVSSASGALARIECLVLTIFHWQKRYACDEPQLLESLRFASTRRWRCVRDLKRFLLQTVTAIIEIGVRTGEFDISERSAPAGVLIDCLAVALDPTASANADDPLTEERIRALVAFLGRALG
jgi:AcrR family transcriptional regulator